MRSQVVWRPVACIQSTLCRKGEKGLKEVFNSMAKPRIKPTGAPTDHIIERLKTCPSEALSFYHNNKAPDTVTAEYKEPVIEVLPNGPLLIHGHIQVKHKDTCTSLKNKVTVFCRCGASSNKPYCDGSHNSSGFNGIKFN